MLKNLVKERMEKPTLKSDGNLKIPAQYCIVYLIRLIWREKINEIELWKMRQLATFTKIDLLY